MKIQILIDNLLNQKCIATSCLHSEWGFAAHIEFNGKNILLDTGASAKFANNAIAMNIDLSKVDCGILSHAHFDHSNGMQEFFKRNDHAPFYLQSTARENCYHQAKFLKFLKFHVYIGIKRGFLKRNSDRIKYADDAEIRPGVFLVSHKDSVLNKTGRAAIGQATKQYVKENGSYRPDSYDHEQSLVFDTPHGLFVMNSCSHGGADNIVKEILGAFPGKSIYAILGGFHLYKTPDTKVREFAERLKKLNVKKIYTGHCTGNRAFEILHEVLGDRAEQMFTGMQITL